MEKRVEGYVKKIRKGLEKETQSWIEVAEGLADIKAYFEHHEDDLAEEYGGHAGQFGWIKWVQSEVAALSDYSPSWFKQTLVALNVHETVEVGTAVSPSVKKHCVVLAALPQRQRKQAWSNAVKQAKKDHKAGNAKSDQVSMRHVVAAADKLLPPPTKKVSDTDINFAVRNAMTDVLENLKPIQQATEQAGAISPANRKKLQALVSDAKRILSNFEKALNAIDSENSIEPAKNLIG